MSEVTTKIKKGKGQKIMKKTLKKMLCGVCSAAMLMGAVSFSASAAHTFTDVKGD